MVRVKMFMFLMLIYGTTASQHRPQISFRQDHLQNPEAVEAAEAEAEWPWMHEGTPPQGPAKAATAIAEPPNAHLRSNPMFHSISTKESPHMNELVVPKNHHGIKLPLRDVHELDDVTLDARAPTLHEEVDMAINDNLHKRLSQKLMAQGAQSTMDVPEVPWWVVLCVSIAFCLLILVLIFYFGAMLMGRSIKSAIETFDRKFIGVDIEIGDLSVAICSGRVDMHGCQVKNPEGYKSPYLLNASHVVIDLNTWALISSFGKRIEVDVLELQDIDCIIEYDKALGGTSNVDRIMEHLNHDTKPSEKKAQQVQEIVNETGKAPPKKEAGSEILLHKVLFSQIGARVATKLGGVRVALGDITFNDFSKENGAHLLEDMIFIIMKSFSKTLMVNITGKSFVDKFM